MGTPAVKAKNLTLEVQFGAGLNLKGGEPFNFDYNGNRGTRGSNGTNGANGTSGSKNGENGKQGGTGATGSNGGYRHLRSQMRLSVYSCRRKIKDRRQSGL